MINAIRATVRVDLIVLGSNPEMADIANPQGWIHGHAAVVLVEAEDGSRWGYLNRIWKHRSASVVEEQAQRFASKVSAALRAGQALNEDLWTPVEPVYGSLAYEREGWEECA